MTPLGKKLAGRFIVLDGPDGTGKSTQLDLLAGWLGGEGVSICKARDPGGTAIGDKIRAILLDKAHDEMSVPCELLLYMASRAQLVAEVIGPALAKGQCVLCDRYISSTVAYQGAAGAAVKDILAAAKIAVGNVWPDLTMILALPMVRRRLKGPPDRIESRSSPFQRRVRKLFREQAAASPRKFAMVSAGGSIEQVNVRLRRIIEKWNFGPRRW